MAFPTKAWHNSPTTDTPISAAALQDLETRVTNIGLGGFTSQTGATYTAVAGDVVLANPASGGITVTLPTVTQSTTVTVVAGSNISPSNLVTISYGSAHIRGPALSGAVSSFTIGNPLSQAQLGSDGTDWYVISGGPSAGQVVGGGATNIATSEQRSNAAYGTLPTPDQVTGVVLPTNGLIRVWYQATWQEGTAGAASAAIFLGSTQIVIRNDNSGTGQHAKTATGTGVDRPLTTFPGGLVSNNSTGFTADVTTGQVVGFDQSNASIEYSLGTGVDKALAAPVISAGGPCDIFAAAGTYTVSIQFKGTAGATVQASNRRLWVQALSFA